MIRILSGGTPPLGTFSLLGEVEEGGDREGKISGSRRDDGTHLRTPAILACNASVVATLGIGVEIVQNGLEAPNTHTIRV
jgi:hypothetical protein